MKNVNMLFAMILENVCINCDLNPLRKLEKQIGPS
jgi:hypothetical protein